MVLSRCCCCISLRKGSLVIGSFNLVLSVAALVFYLKTSRKIVVVYDSKYSVIRHTPSNLSPEVITYLICLITLSAILVTGVTARNSKMIIVYLCGGMINILFITYICATFLIKACTSPEKLSTDRWLEFFLPILIPLIYSYYWLIVFSYYRELTKKPDNGVAILTNED